MSLPARLRAWVRAPALWASWSSISPRMLPSTSDFAPTRTGAAAAGIEPQRHREHREEKQRERTKRGLGAVRQGFMDALLPVYSVSSAPRWFVLPPTAGAGR